MSTLYDQPVTVLARNGTSEQTTLADILQRVIDRPELLEGIGVLLMDDCRLLTAYEDFLALHQARGSPHAANDG